MKRTILYLLLSLRCGVALAEEPSATGKAFAEYAQQLERDADAKRLAAAPSKLPKFQSDEEIDAWLRQQSPSYRSMAQEIDRRGGYAFRAYNEAPGGVSVWQEGKRWIGLNDALTGGERINILIFEVTNHFQEEKHNAIDQDALKGTITDPLEYAILCELVEYDGYRLLLRVLEDLDHSMSGIAPELLQWLSPGAKTLSDCQIPSAYDSIKANRAPGGHHDRYRALFQKLKGK